MPATHGGARGGQYPTPRGGARGPRWWGQRVSDRVYRAALPVNIVIGAMQAERGAHFDPQVLEVFLTAIPEALAVRDRFREERSVLRLTSTS